MPGKSWSEAVESAVRRHVAKTGSQIFSRQALIDSELDAIVSDTGSAGATPHQTLSRELQQLRDAGIIAFFDQGTYRLTPSPISLVQPGSSKGVFVIGSHSIYEDEPERFYRFPPKWMGNASKVVGNWIIYQEPRRAGPRGYYAVAKVGKIVPDPATKDMFLALIEPGTYLEFGRDVPFQLDGQAVERGLLNPDGRLNNGRAIQSIRAMSNADFNRIIDLGLIDEEGLLSRSQEADSQPALVKEDQAPWEGPIDRAIALVSRKVRDRQFRVRVLQAYDSRCALTGMKLINGGGRAETEAAHIMSVEVGGPDVITNGIALSGTVHWMFDRGLISVSDAGDILLSSKINDIEGVSKIIYGDRRARFPQQQDQCPHPRYLAWHRENCFYG